MAAAKVQQPTTERRTDWAEEDEEETAVVLPPPQTIKNRDGTETIITYRLNDQGQKVKRTQRIRKTLVKTVVNPRVAERRHWDKFGLEQGKAAGPSTDTVTIGENIVLKLQGNWRAQQQVDEKDPIEKQKATLKDTKIKCRICSGEHWTSKCPFKDTMAPEGEPGAGGLGLDADEPMPGVGGPGGSGPAGGATAGGSYVPPHLRGKGGATGERMAGERGGKFERDDLATLRVTNVSEFAEENELRDMFSRFGHVTRVFLAKDRETGRAKGFAFVSFADRDAAAKACEKMDGFGYGHLILRVEFAKKAT